VSAFFESPVMQQRLVANVAHWFGTPFVAHARIAGAGVDCVQLAAALYIACGVIESFDPGHYTLQGGKHAGRSHVLDWIRDSNRFKRVQDVVAGDLLCMQFRQRVVHHVGVAIGGGKFVHVLEKRSVEIANLQDFAYRRALKAIYRPLA